MKSANLIGDIMNRLKKKNDVEDVKKDDKILNKQNTYSTLLDKNNLDEANHIHKCNEMLIVEDNVTLLKSYVDFLKNKNITHKAFPNGNSCLD